MPYPNEHAARVADESNCGAFKRMNQGSGVSLILCDKDGKMEAVSYRFAKDKFTPAQAKEWLKKHNLRADKFEAASGDKMDAKLSVKAAKALDGKVWSAGLHHVFVNDKPARVYVPETTIIETFNNMKSKISTDGSIGLGIDHLSDDILNDNDILRKLNLLDVGAVSSIVTDGTGIYIKESNITNDAILNLHEAGELPAYSIVGGMDAKPCPTGKADYIVEHIDVERIDIVGEGGCESCKVGVQPSDIILTAKLSKQGEDIMEVNANEAKVDEVAETPVVDEAVEEPVAEEAEVKEEVVEEVPKEPEVEEPEAEAEEVVAVEEEESEIEGLKKEIAELKEMLGGKKPKVEAKSSDFDIDSEITALIKAGRATPAMRESLTKVAEESEEAFKAMAASMPKFVSMTMESKLAKIEEQTKKSKPKPKTWEEEYGEMAKVFRV